MITRWGLIAALTTCVESPPSMIGGSRVERSEIVMDARPASAAFTSGSRLKIRWATPIGDRAVAVPLEIFDTKLDRVCVIDDRVNACVPKVDRHASLEAFAFFDEAHAHPALLADPSECADPTKPDGMFWAVDAYMPKLDVFTAESARTADANAIWIAGGTGCMITYEHPSSPLCVRPLVDANVREFVAMKEVVRADGLVTMHGDDGSILPRGAIEWDDAANDIRCVLGIEGLTGEPGTEDGCLPDRYDLLAKDARIGEETWPLSNVMGAKWGRLLGDEQWVRLGEERPRSGRKVVDVLRDDAIVHLPSSLGRRTKDDRLALHVRVLPNGESVAIGLYDTKLGRDCVAKRTSSGTLRCVVDLRNACRFTRRLSSDGWERDVLAWDEPRCKNAATCCVGGVVRIEATPDRPPTRHGIDPHSDTIPGTKERVIRFATVAQVHDHVSAWIPEHSVQTYDAIEELDETAFAPLEVARDP